MPTLQIDDLPGDLYRRLLQAAERDHRSPAQQAMAILASALGLDPANRERRRAILSQVRASGEPIKFPSGYAPEDLIREDRQR